MSTKYAPKKRNNISASYNVDMNAMVSVFLDTSRARSEKVYSETAIGSSIINGLVRFVIGPGLEPQASPESSIVKWDEDTRARFIDQAEAFFRLLAGSREIDYYGKETFDSLQVIAFRNILVSGDVLQHRSYWNKKKGYAPYVQLLSGQWVRNPYNKEDSKEVTGGVRFDAKGRETGYYIAETLKNLLDSYDSRYVSKYNPTTGFEEFNLIRLLSREANQVRGIPWLTPVVEDLLDLESFKTAYKTKAATQSLFTGVIETEPEAPTSAVSTMDTIRQLDVQRQNAEALPHNVDDVTLGTGNIIALNPGEKMKMLESQLPATAYAEFIKAELTQIGGAVSLPYEMLMESYNASFSASRATIAGAEKGFKVMREEFATKFCAPVWEQVIDYGIRMGYIEAPGYLEGDEYFKRAVRTSTWIGPASVVIDPVKEVNAHILAVNNKLETREHALRELYSTDFEETVERIKREQSMMADLLDEGMDVLEQIPQEDKENNEDEQ